MYLLGEKYTKQYTAYYRDSILAFSENPKIFRSFRESLTHVIFDFIDIDEYHELASHIAELIKEATKGRHTIFQQYPDFLDPDVLGTPGSLRQICENLHKRTDILSYEPNETKKKTVLILVHSKK